MRHSTNHTPYPTRPPPVPVVLDTYSWVCVTGLGAYNDQRGVGTTHDAPAPRRPTSRAVVAGPVDPSTRLRPESGGSSVKWTAPTILQVNFFFFQFYSFDLTGESNFRSKCRCLLAQICSYFSLLSFGQTLARSYEHAYVRCPVYRQFSPFPFLGGQHSFKTYCGVNLTPSLWYAAPILVKLLHGQVPFTPRVQTLPGHICTD